ncbi:amino acid ABC transporter substrate-binding protein, PAAT family [Devosia sp. YR412]|uniref:ABC transporter substrate-binding protein n=1 Tax=Devosia sp. YR412 TaxID=1881030 RepID=UPI0008AE9D56|nr:ABC transporter substrate-binding protein [Devosia sp. YR412]SEP67258.1 amino acid ABC transporter substrate-binding protein, PAAT family [Devosia sp. YR412]
MLTRKSFLLTALATVLAASSSGLALAQSTFDLSPNPASRLHAEKVDAIAALVPADFDFAKDGTLTIAIAAGAPPTATYATDGATVVGFDPDIGRLVGEVLGIPVEIIPIAWADWPLGLTGGKYDAVISNVGVTEERKEKYDFSTYRIGVHGFYVKADNPITEIKEPKDIAGLKIITGSGTNQERILLEWDRLNQEAGLAPIELQYYDDEAAALLAISSGRADVQLNPNAPLAYQAAVTGQTKLVGLISSGWPNPADVGVTTRKDSGLAEPFTAAINNLIETGTYAELLDQWGVAEESVDVSRTNPPGLPKPKA